MVQHLVVFVIVAVAAAYAAWRWMPAAWRRGAARRLAAGSQRAGLVDAQRAERMAASLGKTAGCGACDSCDGCAAAGPAAKSGGSLSQP